MWRKIYVSTDDCRWLSRDADLTKIEFYPPKTKCIARISTDVWKITGLLSLSLKSAKPFVQIFQTKILKSLAEKKKQDAAVLELYAEFPNINLIWKLAHELRIILRSTIRATTWTRQIALGTYLRENLWLVIVP